MRSGSDMERLPLVSVVVPVHNGGRYVREAVDSVLAQDYERIEVIVVDDGSTDDTAEVLSSYGSRIHVESQPRGGVAAARNAGMRLAAGRFVAFLDADDLWLPGKLSAQVDRWRAQPSAALILTGYLVVDEHLRPRYAVPIRDACRRIQRALTLDAWGVALPITAMVELAAAREVSGYREDLSTSADLDFAHRVSRRWPVASVPDCLALYRTHAGQMHLDRGVLERDMAVFYGHLLREGSVSAASVRRGRANLAIRLLTGELRTRNWAVAVSRLPAIAAAPLQLFRAPAGALARRLLYWLIARRLVRARLGRVTQGPSGPQ